MARRPAVPVKADMLAKPASSTRIPSATLRAVYALVLQAFGQGLGQKATLSLWTLKWKASL